MAQPNNWDGIINLSTIDYITFFIEDSSVRDKISKIAKQRKLKIVKPDFMKNFEQYGNYICLTVEGTAWEFEYAHILKSQTLLDKIISTLYDSNNNCYLVEMDA